MSPRLKVEQENLLKSLGLSDLPRRKWFGFLVHFFKTFEVLIFKLIQSLDLYRPQKSILGIPSLGLPSSTILQALVYNGTQEEVLAFRPRRLFHRIIRGLPDLEAFERLRFSLTSGGTVRSVEASTESRGFVNLVLPWKNGADSPRKAYLRLSSGGVETLVGTMSLGNYEISSSPVFFLSKEVKWIVLSDIDDTIKDSNIAESTSFKKILRGIFRGHYYDYDPISGMAELYQDIAARGGLIIYVTSTPYQLAPFLLKFLRQCNFPEGPVFLRWLGYGRFGHKWRTLSRVLTNVESQRCFLIGDSGEQDLQIYRRLYETSPLNESIEKILIRHVPGTPLQRVLHDREEFYNDITELRQALKPILDEPVLPTPSV